MSAVEDEDLEGLPLPRRFGRYVLFDRIGKGGMAEIYLAQGTTHLGAQRLAVVKLVLPRFSRDPHFATMLVSEAKLAARLSHRNIVQTFDLGREDDKLFIAMEYVEGFDVNQLLRRLAHKKIGLPAEYGFFIVREMLRALDYAHRRADEDGNPLGLVHRDVSPSNVLVSLEGEVKLCDFGIARAMTDKVEMPSEALEGKYAYMSPEHARGERVDGRSDVFAATIILWEMMSGRRMYKAQPGKEVVDLAREGAVPSLPDRGLPYYDRLNAIVRKGLSADRDARYATAGAMLRDLDEYVSLADLDASPLRFGEFLQQHFESEIVDVRRQRELAAVALAGSAPVEVMPDLGELDSPPVPLPSRAPTPRSTASLRPPSTPSVRTNAVSSEVVPVENLSEFVEAATVNIGAQAVRSVQDAADAAAIQKAMRAQRSVTPPPIAKAPEPAGSPSEPAPPALPPPAAMAAPGPTPATPVKQGIPVWVFLVGGLLLIGGIVAAVMAR